MHLQRFVKNDFKCWQETLDKCGIDSGCPPEGYEPDEERSKKKSDREYFTKRTKKFGTFERIHLYGSHVIPPEKEDEENHKFSKFGEGRVLRHNVIYWIAEPGSVMAAQSDDKVIHFAAENKSRRLVLVSCSKFICKRRVDYNAKTGF